MPAKRTAIFNQGQGQQRGAVLMIMLVIMVIGLAAVLVNSLTTVAANNARQATTAAALAQAKDALIGYAVSDPNRPGDLPCPDVDDDGKLMMNIDYNASGCISPIGRLPWKTLKLPELRDGAGEHLWYTVSKTFWDTESTPINSNTIGNLTVSGITAASNVIAIVFAAGPAISGQSRSPANQAVCATNGLTVAESWCATNYLEGSNPALSTVATPNMNYQSANSSSTFNDQLLYITTKDLIPLVEQRVAGVVKQALSDYYAANGYYPWADSVPASSDYNSNEGLNRGWLPYLSSTPSSPAEWCCTSFPAWFYNNEWYKLIYYSVAKNYTANPSYCYYYGSCSSSSTLSVDGVNGVRALFFMPGTYAGTRILTDLTQYLEDSQNNDDANDLYVTPASQARDRDRLYRLP